MDQKPRGSIRKIGIFTGARCGNIVQGQTILITGIRDPCGYGSRDCFHMKSGECNGTSYYVEEYTGTSICSRAITLSDSFTLDQILGLVTMLDMLPISVIKKLAAGHCHKYKPGGIPHPCGECEIESYCNDPEFDLTKWAKQKLERKA